MSFFEVLGTIANEAEELHAAFEAGQIVGEQLNEHIVQPYLDHEQVGAGEAGEAYLHWINEHNFDPMHPLDSLHHEPDHTDHAEPSHDHYDSSLHDDYSDHHSDFGDYSS